ncbi:MAG: hypothetical protein A2406_01945 [Candidatus Komeilibacteria bacterium RIFOXYC1_FULL_37_11]|uniref:Uncharacterized protein n=1 Tax=Candidatus Komeilibacteria bacterium RIFOXYC1_FULL_37_11 TaxID=1798555 RepID=A0A1G2C0A5_9BACT|nr:MAG: hypothetical protein A2406_01945 [Candidatus Komeilibacteria bacterium RIFOXYC1_FULL_37_11]OGY95543.1 MAG: hypothetical protein A2611_02495 [Candidatus Komeilibacteria bacterium RIFOXYD1_FULL_37_29]
MSKEKRIEQPSISQESGRFAEQSVEKSLDGAKLEKFSQSKEQPENDNISPTVNLDDGETSSNAQANIASVIHQKIENVLAEGMEDVYLSLDAGTQKVFKTKGEDVSVKITNLLLQAKIKVKEITKLILEWLRLIPRVNKHYLEQEAKIKTEKILKINQPK